MEKVIIGDNLLFARIEHEKYQMNLSDWKKYVIWSYTLGSGIVNSYLIDKNNLFENNLINVYIWSERIFGLFAGSVSGTAVLPENMRSLKKYFDDPESYEALPKQQKIRISEKLLVMYIITLKNILRKSPQIEGNITVYKASSAYPGLKDKGPVFQRPFNSTSFREDFDFSFFLGENPLCCIHKLTIKNSVGILIISPVLAAYPDENEILLPPGVNFNVYNTGKIQLDLPHSDNEFTYRLLQTPPYVIGPVYAYESLRSCSTEKHIVKIYDSIVDF